MLSSFRVEASVSRLDIASQSQQGDEGISRKFLQLLYKARSRFRSLEEICQKEDQVGNDTSEVFVLSSVVLLAMSSLVPFLLLLILTFFL